MSALVSLALLLAADDFEQVEVEAVQLPTEQGIARMETWVTQNSSNHDVPRALLWEAQQRLAQQRFADARRLLERAAGARPDDELALDLALTLADVDALEGRYDDAARRYESLHAPAGSRWEMQATLRGGAMRGQSQRRNLMQVLVAISAVLIGTRLFRRRAHLWPPPEEVTWSAPVLLALGLAALARPAQERGAVLLVCVGGAGLLWLTGSTLRQRALRWPSRLGELLVGAFLCASLLFCAIVVCDLWPRVADTFAAGTE